MALKMENKGGGEIDPPAAGTHLGRLVGLVDLDHQPGFEYEGKQIESMYKIQFIYELGNSLNKDEKPHWISEDLKISKHERSNMLSRVNALDPTGELSSKGNNLVGLINAPCMVEVVHNAKGYGKVKNVSAPMAGYPVPELANDPVLFDFETPDMEVFKRLPEFVQNKIKDSLNFTGSDLDKALTMQGDDVPF